jgi:hypothetical protein
MGAAVGCGTTAGRSPPLRGDERASRPCAEARGGDASGVASSRTSRSDDGCAALTGGTSASSKLNSRSPADAVLEGTKRSEYTVSFFPLEPGVLAIGNIVASAARAHSEAGRAGYVGTPRLPSRQFSTRATLSEISARAFRHDTTRLRSVSPRATRATRLEMADTSAAVDDVARLVMWPLRAPSHRGQAGFVAAKISGVVCGSANQWGSLVEAFTFIRTTSTLV